MSVPTLELLLLAIGAGAGCVAALFAVLCFVRAKRPEGTLTKDNAPHLLRSETDVVRAVVQDQARWLRQELGQSLTGFQELTLASFGTMSDGIDAQIRKAIDERAAAISA
jgi:hypothetical protein